MAKNTLEPIDKNKGANEQSQKEKEYIKRFKPFQNVGEARSHSPG